MGRYTDFEEQLMHAHAALEMGITIVRDQGPAADPVNREYDRRFVKEALAAQANLANMVHGRRGASRIEAATEAAWERNR